MTAMLLLDSVEKVNAFVGIALTKPYDIDLISGKYVINGKSVMGIFSLDLTKPVMVNANVDNDEAFIKEIQQFVAK